MSNSKHLPSALLVHIFFIISNCFAASWYVDNAATGNNNGTSWKNAWRSFASINWGSVQPGDTIYISGGASTKTYFETLNLAKSGTSEKSIVIRVGQEAGHNGTVVIDGQKTRTNNIRFAGSAGYIIINGSVNGQIRLEVKNTRDDGILDESANHIELAYLEIMNNGNDIQDDGYYVHPETAAGGNKIHHCKIHDNYGDQVAGYIGTPAPAFPNFYYEIYENEIYNLHDDGIEMNIGGLVIHDNHLHTRVLGVDYGHADAIQIEGAEYIKIYNNVIHGLNLDVSNSNCTDCGSNALIFVDPVGNSDTRHAHDIYIYNNVVYETSPPINDVFVRGVDFKLEDNIQSTKDVYIVNNTAVDIPLWGISVTFNHSSNVRNVFVENNLLYNTAQIGDRRVINIERGGAGGSFTLGSHGAGADVTIDYNLVHPGASGNTRIGLREATYDYNEFKANTGIQKNGVTTAPKFVSYAPYNPKNNFQPSSLDNSARDRGIPQTFFAMDNKGTSRPQSAAWDIGAFEFGTQSTVGGGEISEEQSFFLQNYPNPFTPGTTIYYSLSSPAQVKIKIYNQLGQLIRVLKEESTPAGRYTVSWNGKNEHGETVASGMYVYQIETGEQVYTRKMLLVR